MAELSIDLPAKIDSATVGAVSTNLGFFSGTTCTGCQKLSVRAAIETTLPNSSETNLKDTHFNNEFLLNPGNLES